MRVAVVVLIAGCGRVGFDPVADGVDGQPAGLIDSSVRVAYRDAVMADGPSGYWRLGDTGSSATDETATTAGTFGGNCQHSQPSMLTGDPNLAARFDGTSCYITLGNTYAFGNRAPYTLELWYRPTSTTLLESLITKQTRLGSMPDDGYLLFNSNGGVYAERSVGAQNVRTNATPATPGTTYHFVATYDGTQIALYKNGVLAAPKVTATAILPVYAAPAVIGAFSDTLQMYASGMIDEVAIYPTALAADRVAMHYDIGTNGPR